MGESVAKRVVRSVREKRVIDAAREWEKAGAISDALAHGSATRNLIAAIQALDAPNPVKPEEVPPGTRFRLKSPDWPMDDEVFTLVHMEVCNGEAIDQVPIGLTEHFSVFEFSEGDLVIPIPEGEEGE